MNGTPNWSVGERLEERALPPISRLQLIKYAGASGDYNPIHLLDEAAEEAGLPGVIAHGMLTVATMGLLFSPHLGHGYVKTFGSRFSGMETTEEGVLYTFDVYARNDTETAAAGVVGFLVYGE